LNSRHSEGVSLRMKYKSLLLLPFLGLLSIGISSEVKECPGEGDRYGDFKCNHDQTHRVCAKLIDNKDTCKEVSWDNEGDTFWEITGQQGWNWKEAICKEPNPGDSWCICMWATASLIEKVGCKNVHIHCEATDVGYVLNSYTDGGRDLASAKECIKQKCELKDGKYINKA